MEIRNLFNKKEKTIIYRGIRAKCCTKNNIVEITPKCGQCSICNRIFDKEEDQNEYN